MLGINEKVLLNYWLRRISVSLQVSVAESILSRSYKYRSANVQEFDVGLSKDMIKNSSKIRCVMSSRGRG